VGGDVDVGERTEVEDVYGETVRLGDRTTARKVQGARVRVGENVSVTALLYSESLDGGEGLRAPTPPRKVDKLDPPPI